MSVGSGSFIPAAPVFGGGTAWTGSFSIPFAVAGTPGTVFSGSGGNEGSFSASMPVFYGESSSGETYGFFHVPSITFSGSGSSPEISGYQRFNVPLITFSGIVAGVSTGLFTIPSPVFFDIRPNAGIGLFDIPLGLYGGHGIATPSGGLYLGVAMNILNQAISTYNNYPFNSIAYHGGNYYGATSTGIYRLEGDKDLDRYINAKIKSGFIDLGENLIRRLRAVWLTCRSNGQLALVFATKENESDRTSDLPTSIVNNDIHEERVTCPRGLRGRYYMVELKNLSGSDFDIAKISLMVEAIRRKLR